MKLSGGFLFANHDTTCIILAGGDEMAVLQAGKILKQYLERTGITPEQLCGKDYDISSLRRVLNGNRGVSMSVFANFLSKLGENPERLYLSMASNKEIAFFDLYYEIEGHILNDEYALAESKMVALSRLERNLPQKEGVNIRNQMMLVLSCSIMEGMGADTEKRLQILKPAAELILPELSSDAVATTLLSYDDIALLNLLATALHEMGQQEQAIEILLGVSKSINTFQADAYEKSRGYTQTLYNLSTFYGLEGRHAEALEACDAVIKCSLQHRRLHLLPHAKFNKARAMHALGKHEGINKLAVEAYYAMLNNGNYADAEMRLPFITDVLGIDLPIY
jgi:tetratricopeptide (TPR) repeat protein